jgi:hypothetical protein
MLPYDFITKVENKLNYILYTDTDSLFINVPEIKPESIKEAVEIAQDLSEEINQVIQDYNINHLFPKMGISAEHNKTFYKTELVIESMILLDSKKNYAYNLVAKEGKIFDKPDTKYTGIPVVRTDYSKFTRDFIRQIVEKIALNKNRTESGNSLLQKIAKEFYTRLEEDIEKYDFTYIGTPCKWNSSYKDNKMPFQVIGMQLYNTIIGEAIFSPLSAGVHVPIIIENHNKFNDMTISIKNKDPRFIKNTPLSNLTKLVVPYGYDIEKLRSKMISHTIKVDKNETWSVLYSKVAERIVDLIKKNT